MTSGTEELIRSWAEEHRDILALIWGKFDGVGDWPAATVLQRELYAAGQRVKFGYVGREIPPSLGRFDSMTGKLALTARGLSFVPAARPLLDAFTRLVREAIMRYRTHGAHATLDAGEFVEVLDIDEHRARQLKELALLDGWLFRAVGEADRGQRFAVDEDAVLDIPQVRTIEDYLHAQAHVWWPTQEAMRGDRGPKIHARPAIADLTGFHTLIMETCASVWENGHRREAVDRAAIALIDAVRQLSGQRDLDGDELMKRAFSPSAPSIVVADLRTRTGQSIQRGTHLIAMGAIAAIRNPNSHRLDEPSVDEALEKLAVLSFVARRLDDARDALAGLARSRPPT
jgi:uncharacterized protein (TIGR02391 family)